METIDGSYALQLAKRIRAISQTGITYVSDDYNIGRYNELLQISNELMQLVTAAPLKTISDFYIGHKEYPTPKTDIRAVVFNQENEILLVKEKADGKWSLPGGWADIGSSPKEVVIKEVAEETGFTVRPVKLLAVLDKKFYPHPPEPEYVYKYFIQCAIMSGDIIQAHDIEAVHFFPRHAIPPLSENRVLPSQVDLMFEFLFDAAKEVIFD